MSVEERPAKSEIWQARIPAQLARDLEKDAEILGLVGRSEIVREALTRLHRQAAEQRMADEIAEYYGGKEAPLPDGVAR
ncbi:ribbon-helix-helix protein, CopG family [Jiangella gansuensis]|uniref:ribbon-helix-helix protein, CopG family n=1 Tax=Jiangella gansuensis TaxID=281473 RepID=UPI0004787544|nr:ribbon-helix-helix protein, CopG family [Jiangella gansuensis]